MQRLSAAQHTGKGLDRDSRNIVQRLLHSQRNAGRLGVKPHLHRAWIFRPKTLLHRPRPDHASGAIFGDLLKEIVVSVKEK